MNDLGQCEPYMHLVPPLNDIDNKIHELTPECWCLPACKINPETGFLVFLHRKLQ